MNTVATLRALASGARPQGQLLPPCRLSAFGTSAYGEEAIVQSFRNAPLALSDAAQTIEAEGHCAIFDGDNALFADLYGTAIARIWRLGPGEPGKTEPMIGVPFDPDLCQARGDVAFRAEDHPALAAEASDALIGIARDEARSFRNSEGPGPYRSRVFVIRAFSALKEAAALFAVHRLGPDAQRSAGFSFVATRFRVEDCSAADIQIVRDRAGEAAIEQAVWRPCVA